ncbi:hypothetical protein ACFU8I_17915 [Streptomyces sp. NPDC057540]|uniref:hypothetical protein n=1 Tax=Streptomyces sp. NPDC057540 TaxID=3346160 RepID=UPI0036AABFFC
MTARRGGTGEAGWVVAGCWAWCALSVAVLSLPGGRSLPVALPVMVVLVWWFWGRRDWAAGVAAGCAGSFLVLAAVDRLRPLTGRAVADPLTVGLGATVAVAVFVLIARARTARGERKRA